MAYGMETLDRRALAATVVSVSTCALIYDPQTTAFIAKTTTALAVALVFLAMMARRLWHVGMLPPSLLGGIGLVAFFGASLAWSRHPDGAQHVLWLAGLALGIGCAALPRRQRIAIATHCALIIGGVTGLVVAVQLMSARGMALHGGHGNPNWAGLVVAVALPLGVHAVWSFEGRWRIHAWVCVALSLVALLACGSHTAWFAVASATVVCSRKRILGAALLAGLLGYLFFSPSLTAALSGRLWIWRVATDVLAHNPLVGGGSGEFPFAFLEAQGHRLGALALEDVPARFVNATTAHNDWLQAGCDGGLLGVALLLATGLLGVVAHWRAWRAGAAALIVVGVAMLGDSPLHQPGVVVLVGITLAAAPSPPPPSPPSPPSPPPRSPRTSGASAKRAQGRRLRRAVGVALVFAAVAVAMPGQARRWLSQRELVAARGLGPAPRLVSLERAVALDPSFGEALLELGLHQYQLGQHAPALVSLDRSADRLANVSTSVAIGNAKLQTGDTAGAIRAFREALAKHPALVRAHVNLAEALRRDHQWEQASAHVDAARELQPHLPETLKLEEQLRRDTIDAAIR